MSNVPPPGNGPGPQYQPPQQGFPQQGPGQQPPQYQPPAQQPPQQSQQPYQQYQQPGVPGPASPGPVSAPGGGGGGGGGRSGKKFPVWLLLLILVGLPVLAIGSCTAWLVVSVRGEVDRGNEFLAELQAGDTAGAQALVNPECDLDVQGIQDFFGNSTITSYNLTGGGFNNGVSNASGTITFDGDDERTIQITFVDDQVCGIDIGAVGETGN